MKILYTLLDDFNGNHLHEINRTVQFLCIPLIYLGATTFFYAIKIGNAPMTNLIVTGAHVFILIGILIYMSYSFRLTIGIVFYGYFYIWLAEVMEENINIDLAILAFGLIIFGLLGQVFGYKFENHKINFSKYLKFLFLGPLWVLSAIYKTIGIKY